eukprot:350125_1
MAHTAVATNDNNLWVADFKCSEARNGIVEIIVNNINSLYDQLDLYDPAENILIIHCIFPETLSRHSNCEYIEYVNISQHSQIYIKFPMYFNAYNINISIQGHSHTIIVENGTKTIMTKFPKSKPKMVHVPSFLTCDGYKIGESIRIRDPRTSNMIHGEVSNILNDNIYEIEYNTVNTETDCKQINLPISSIYPKAALLTYTLKWETICNGVNMNLYFHKYVVCKNTKSTICAIFDFFENDRCFGNGYDTWLLDYGHYDRYYLETLSNFLVQNICEFLFEVAYEYNIDCLVNEFDGRLKFDNVGKYYLTQQECIIHCDCCGAPLNEFDFAYFCDGIHKKQKIQKIPKNPHKVCIECVCTTFNAWDELEPLLRQLLHDKLDSDCIKIIIDYVIGKICMTYIGDNIETDIVKYTTHAHENIYDENQDIINGDVEMIHDSEENISLISECEKRLVTNNSNNESISLEPLFKKRRLNNQ